MKIETKKITVLALFSAVAIIFSYIEAILPPIWSAIPGIKVGLSNIVTVALLYKFSLKEAAIVAFIRIIIIALLFGNVMTLIYSIAGFVLSVTIMAILKRTSLFSTVGVSIAGGVFHNLGQIIVAMILLQTKEIGYYMIVLAITGTVAGILIGIAGNLMLKYSNKLRI
ncbi:MAG: Gx transporter family protein [Clostridia bacterium]|nr:Gx transporter family protein [Clostridia bacterium]MBQ9957525.1 Gx transporter family protein [Clostridia bacterium]